MSRGSAGAGGSGGGTLGGGLRQRHRRHLICLLLAGVQPGDEVLVPALTFIAPINAVRYVSAEPVFLDCDDYLNLDVANFERFLEEECRPATGGLVNRNTGRRVRAVVPVHVFGSICDMEPLLALAAKYRLAVIENDHRTLGSRMKTGALRKHAGTMVILAATPSMATRSSQAVAAAWLSPAALRSWPGPNI